ncbi:MAG TPA: hypothetical protein VM165_00070 [Planctomycetaceae bacterium]|nr:hypothetical protein [Planctomycetaceae bacterium]
MPRGDKSKYTDKQKRMAEHIEEGYKAQGVSDDIAEQRAWATVNATDGGGKKPGGSGRGKPRNPEPAKKGGRKGGAAVHAKRATKSKKSPAHRKSSKKTKKA